MICASPGQFYTSSRSNKGNFSVEFRVPLFGIGLSKSFLNPFLNPLHLKQFLLEDYYKAREWLPRNRNGSLPRLWIA